MALYTLDDTKLRIEVVPAKGHTVHGGQVAVAALCKKLGLWALVRTERALDPRTDRTRGFAPEVMVAQLVISLCCGGVSLADAERLQSDKGVCRALGVTRFADQTQLGEWLRGLGPDGLAALRRVLRQTVARALKNFAPRARCAPAANSKSSSTTRSSKSHRQKNRRRRPQLRRPARARLAGAVRRPVSRGPDRHRR